MKPDADDTENTDLGEENGSRNPDLTETNRPPSQQRRKPFNPTTIALATLIVTIIGIVIATTLDLPGAILNTRTIMHGETTPSTIPVPSNRPESKTSTDSKHTQQRASSTTETSPSPGCYDGDTPTPCGSPHSREVFAKPDGASCDEGALVLHMGGVPGIDLLASGIDVEPLENTDDLCVVEKLSGMPSVSLKDIWTVDNDHNGYKDGGEFRRCLNRQGQQVSCDTEHASEEFFDAPIDVDCFKKYEEFSGRQVDRSIRIAPDTRDNHIICRAEVQVSTDRLTASVRDLENASLPIKQS